MQEALRVKADRGSFVSFVVAGQAVEVHVDELAGNQATLSIKAAKQIKSLRVLRELPGLDAAPEDNPLAAKLRAHKPPAAGDDQAKRAAAG